MSHCEFGNASARGLRQEPGNGSKFLEVKIVAADAKVCNDVGDDATRHVARMPGKSNEPVRMKWV
jgi:hypothetical protein